MKVDRSLVWIPCPGMSRDEIIADIRKDSVAIADKGDHLWVVVINNLGPCLFCFGIAAGKDESKSPPEVCYVVKRIPETVGPDVYDCPMELLDSSRPVNETWREQARNWNAKSV